MAIVINTNVSSLFAQQNLGRTQENLSNTLTRLSSGLRINKASDDPAGLAISEGMLSTINGLNQGSRNGNDGISLVEAAEGSMQTILNDLQRMRELASQASTGTYSSSDLTNLDTEYQALLGEISRVTTVTTFNGVAILNGGSVSIQVGANDTSDDRITIHLSDTSASTLNISSTSLTSQANAQSALGSLTAAITTVTTGLAQLGADQSDLHAAINSNDTLSTNLSSAKSRILDADYAAESSNLAKQNILSQAGVAMLSQANSLPSLVLSLLRQ